MEAIILAGGRGSRLAGAVPNLPKPMAPIADPSGDRPFLEYVLDALSSHGFTRAVLSVGYMADAIVGHFGESYAGLALRYCHEDEPLGTGGAIAAALPMTDERDVFVLNGDTYATVDYTAMLALHRQQDALLTIALTHVPDASRYGAVVVQDGQLTGFCEKGTGGQGAINAGVYLMRRDLMKAWDLPPRFSFEDDILTQQLETLQPAAFLTDGYFIDIGVVADYQRAQRELVRMVG